MRVVRQSGMPLEPTDIPRYTEELSAAVEVIHKELGRFEKLSQTEQGKFVRRFQEVKAEVNSKYTFEAVWDFETTIKSKQSLKKLINHYGPIGIGYSDETNQLTCFILDKG